MQREEMIRIAKIAIRKRWDWETLNDSDYMDAKRPFTDDVYEFVIECREIGEEKFQELYGSI